MLPAALAAWPAGAASWRGNLSGLWNNASGTPLQRRPNFKSLVLEAPEAAGYEAHVKNAVNGIPGDDVGQDGAEWWTPDLPLLRVGGQVRTSVIIDPPDGRLPYSSEGRGALVARLRAQNNFDGADSRPAVERCLIGFGDPVAPPMLYQAQTSGDYQFVQTPDALLIRAESNHDFRVVGLGLGNGRSELRPAWHGVSRGQWQGETLVIETSGFQDLEGLRSAPDQLYLSPDARVEERLTRRSADMIHYEFLVDDPRVFARPWRGESAFRNTGLQVLDYECHEGNYALPNILRGARAAGPR